MLRAGTVDVGDQEAHLTVATRRWAASGQPVTQSTRSKTHLRAAGRPLKKNEWLVPGSNCPRQLVEPKPSAAESQTGARSDDVTNEPRSC